MMVQQVKGKRTIQQERPFCQHTCNDQVDIVWICAIPGDQALAAVSDPAAARLAG